MDGFPFLPSVDLTPLATALPVQHRQQTLKSAISCSGIGLHSGRSVSVRLVPAAPAHGIVFLRTDLGTRIPARFDAVTDTRLCTAIGELPARVGTIEHLMAALSALRIDNVLIELDGPELPVLDGSSEPWLFLLDCAGLLEQDAPRAAIEVLRTVRVEEGDAFAELRPGPARLELAVSIAFDAPAIGRQALSLPLDAVTFRNELALARTFTQRHEIEGLQKAGLARGGDLGNAVVVDGAQVLNPGGLRMTDEFVRHKMLDAVGDLALAGAPLHARFIGSRSGHALNNRVLRALFADAANWRWAALPHPAAEAMADAA